MRVDGKCHCGAINFEAEVTPGTIWICHCADCQTLTGSAYRTTVLAPAASFVVHGRPAEYIRTTESGATKRLAFCPRCGTPIFGAATQDPTMISLRVGTLRQRAELGSPTRQIWCRSALAWAMTLEAVPRAEGQP